MALTEKARRYLIGGVKAFYPLVALSLCLFTAACSDESEEAEDDTTPVTYTNPVGGDIYMGDPFIVRYGETYYLTGTTDSGRGFRMWSSANLVDWNPLGMVFAGDGWADGSYWAAELFTYQGKYYLAYSANKRGVGFRLGLAIAGQPEGPYTSVNIPWCDTGDNFIDAHVFIDEDGTPYIYYARVDGLTSTIDPGEHLAAEIWGAQLSADLSEMVTEPQRMVTPELEWELEPKARSWANEGAFVLRHGNTYYLTFSSGHYAEARYAIGYATASNPLGPWTKAVEPIVRQVPELGVSGPGHCSVTLAPDGKTLLMVYHAHADIANPSGHRTVNIDPIRFEPAESGPNRMILDGPTRSPQPVPGLE